MRYLILIVLVFSITSCRTQKDISTPIGKPESVDKQELFKSIKKTVDFSTLKIKASANIEAEKNYPSVSTILYINKGKQIWVNASLIIPIARANISPSGFKMYEKISKTYIDSDFNYINNLLKVNFIDYQSIENLLLGRLFFPVSSKEFNLSIEDTGYILTSLVPIKVGSGKDIRDFSSKITYDSNFNLKQIMLEDKIAKTFLKVDYGEYIDFEGKWLPKNIKIFIKEKKEAEISLDYNKFETVKMETPFEIPKGYTQRIIN